MCLTTMTCIYKIWHFYHTVDPWLKKTHSKHRSKVGGHLGRTHGTTVSENSCLVLLAKFRAWTLESWMPEFKSQLWHWSAEWHWASCLTSLRISHSTSVKYVLIEMSWRLNEMIPVEFLKHSKCSVWAIYLFFKFIFLF